MIQLHPDERCTCSRPRYVRTYLRRPACLCGHFIVHSPIELAALHEAELRQLEREKALSLPSQNGNGSHHPR